MKRLGRWTLRTLMGLSLALCAATLVLWVRSYGSGDQIALRKANHEGEAIRYRLVGVASRDGAFGIFSGHMLYSHDSYSWMRNSLNSAPPAPGEGWRLRVEDEERQVIVFLSTVSNDANRFAGMGRYRRFTPATSADPFDVTLWLIPHPYLAGLFALPSAVWLSRVTSRSVRRRSRRRRGLCLNCGYDLRATRGPCPECGREPEDGPPAIVA